MWKWRLKCVDRISQQVCGMNVKLQTMKLGHAAGFDLWMRRSAVSGVAKRRWKLARHKVSGQRHKKFRPEGTMEMWKRDYRADVSAVPSGRKIFCGTLPDTLCLANFRLCLRHERRPRSQSATQRVQDANIAKQPRTSARLSRGATVEISQLRSGWWRIDENSVLKGRRTGWDVRVLAAAFITK